MNKPNRTSALSLANTSVAVGAASADRPYRDQQLKWKVARPLRSGAFLKAIC